MNNISSLDIAFTRKLDEIVRANLENEHFGVKELASESGMSRFNLNRKLHSLHRKTINQYIRDVRLQRAMEILLLEPVTAAEVAYRVGFSSPAYFSTCFSDYFGFPPGEARKRSLFEPQENKEEPTFEADVTKPYFIQSILKRPNWKKWSKWAMLTFTLIILFVVGLVYFFNHKNPETINFISANQINNHKRSIAVLPFINDSKDPENVYFINGIMEAILDNLSTIKDLDVRPRTSVEQYRYNKTKAIPQIAKELGVNYIIEGSGQKIGDQVSLYIQLIEPSSDKHLFSNRYNMKLEDIFNLQSEIAIKVASKIKAVITSEEKELIEKIPTSNFAAMNLFLQANDVHNIAELEGKWELDIKAERLYKRAIQLDSTYAAPYASLGWIILDRNVDSALYLATKALQFDAKNPEAYNLKGFIYFDKGMFTEAEEAYLKSIKYKPNNSSAFRFLGDLYLYQGNCSAAIEYQLQAFHLESNSIQQRNNIESFCSSLYTLGFYKEGEIFASRLLELNNDSSFYFWGLVSAQLDLGNNKTALKYALKMFACDENDLNNTYLLFYTYIFNREYKEAYILLQKYKEIMKQQGRIIKPNHLFGFICLENGKKREADYHFEGSIQEMLKYITQNQPSVTCQAYLILAKIFSVRNENTKALENLQKGKECLGLTIISVKDFKNCPMFDNIRNTPAFADYLKEAEFKYRQEHEKVEKLLRTEGILNSSAK